MGGTVIDVRTVAKHGGEAVRLIRLPLAHPGFEEFLGAWLVTAGDATLIDCGVTGSYAALKSALDRLGVVPDRLLLTHVHLDHSGAAGCLCRDFPGMKVFCFERAARHLVAPAKLWGATSVTLGAALAAAYQPPLPVPREAIVTREQLPAEWTVLDTPGHATHHVSFLRTVAGRRVCFGGETLGVVAGDDVTSWFADGVRRNGLRPATPPTYVPEIGRGSMQKIAAAPWDLYCSGHFGATDDRSLPARAIAQNRLWEATIAQALADGLNETEMVELMRHTDPELAGIAAYTAPNRTRETYFIGNSVRGFVKFLQEQAEKELAD